MVFDRPTAMIDALPENGKSGCIFVGAMQDIFSD